MHERNKTILNEEGLHARPAGILAKEANGFQSKVELSFNGRKVNAKSSMSLMTLGLVKGSEIQLHAEGPDAEQAVDRLSLLIDQQFKA